MNCSHADRARLIQQVNNLEASIDACHKKIAFHQHEIKERVGCIDTETEFLDRLQRELGAASAQLQDADCSN